MIRIRHVGALPSVLFALSLLVFGTCAHAQDKGDTAAKLKEIGARPDSVEKLAALLALERSGRLTGDEGSSIRQTYRNTLFGLYKTAALRTQILDGLESLIEATPEIDRDDANREAAQDLLTKHLLPDDAAALTRKGLVLFERYDKTHMRQEAQKMQAREARFLTTLGQAYYQAGDMKQAEANLAKAFPGIPTDDDTAELLAKINERAGNHQAAADYLLPDVLSGTATTEIVAMLRTVYNELHPDAAAGYERWLDDAYEHNEDSVLPVTQYTAEPPADAQVALVEYFGSATCLPCTASTMATDAMLKRYPAASVVLLSYHQNIPNADPMTSGESDARREVYDINATPRVYVNGTMVSGMGGDQSDAPSAYDALSATLDRELSRSAPARLEITAALSPAAKVTGQARLTGLHLNDANILVQVVLVENRIHFVGRNGVRVHRMVVREVANGGAGYIYKGTQNETYAFTFDIHARNEALRKYLSQIEREADTPFTFGEDLLPINTAQLSVVAFVQNAATKEILQATILPLTTTP